MRIGSIATINTFGMFDVERSKIFLKSNWSARTAHAGSFYQPTVSFPATAGHRTSRTGATSKASARTRATFALITRFNLLRATKEFGGHAFSLCLARRFTAASTAVLGVRVNRPDYVVIRSEFC
jgi:hypothetical protein